MKIVIFFLKSFAGLMYHNETLRLLFLMFPFFFERGPYCAAFGWPQPTANISAWPWILSLLPHPPLHYWVSVLYSVLYLWTLFAKHGRFYCDIFNVQVMFSWLFLREAFLYSFPFYFWSKILFGTDP